MNEISFPLLDKWRCSISLSSSGKEDLFKHDRVSISMETRSCRQLPVGRRDAGAGSPRRSALRRCVACCRRCADDDVDPRAWLADVLGRIDRSPGLAPRRTSRVELEALTRGALRGGLNSADRGAGQPEV